MKKLLIVLVGISVVGFIVSGSIISYSKQTDEFALSPREKITNYVKENVLPIVREKRSELDLGADEQKIDELRRALKTHREEMLEIRKSHRELMKNNDNAYLQPDPVQMDQMQEMRFEHQKMMHDVFSIVLKHEEEIEAHLDYLKVYMGRWRNDIQDIASEWRAENEKTMGNKKLRPGYDKRPKGAPDHEFDLSFSDRQGFGRNSLGRYLGHFLQPSAYVLLDPENMEEMFEMQRYNHASLFPNPASGPINIPFEVSENALVQVHLFNSQGNRIETILNKTYNSGKYTLTYDSRDLTPGVYYYEVIIGEEVIRNRFVKK